MADGKWIHADAALWERYPALKRAVEEAAGEIQDGQKVKIGISNSRNLKVSANCDMYVILRKELYGDARKDLDAFHKHLVGNVGFPDPQSYGQVAAPDSSPQGQPQLDRLCEALRQEYQAKYGRDAAFRLQMTERKKTFVFQVFCEGLHVVGPASVPKKEFQPDGDSWTTKAQERQIAGMLARMVAKQVRKEEEEKRQNAYKTALKAVRQSLARKLDTLDAPGAELSWDTIRGQTDVAAMRIRYGGRWYRLPVKLVPGDGPVQADSQGFQAGFGQWLKPVRTEVPGEARCRYLPPGHAGLEDRTMQVAGELKAAVLAAEIPLEPAQENHPEAAMLISYVHECNTTKDSWLEGTRKPMTRVVTETLNLAGRRITLTNGAGTVTITDGAIEETLSGQCREFLDQKADPVRASLTEVAIRELGGFQANTMPGGCQPGILNGDTVLSIPWRHGTIRYEYKTPPCTEREAWLAALADNKEKIGCEIRRCEEQRARELKARCSLYASSWLCMDIFRAVQANEKYITANGVVQILRGTKVTLDTDIRYTEARGRYNAMPAGEIKDTIDAMVQDGMLYEVGCSTRYYDFDFLKPDKDAAEYLREWQEPELTEEQQRAALEKLRSGDSLQDDEAGTLIRDILAREEHTSSDYIDLVLLAQSPAAVLRYIGEINQAFQGAPKEAVMYARMRKDASEGMEKKILLLYLRKSKTAPDQGAALRHQNRREMG